MMSPLDTVQSLFEKAVARHQAGQLDEAAALYQRVLAASPNHPDATHLLGVIRSRDVGQSAAGIDLIRRAIAIRPDVAAYYESLGIALAAAGDFNAAISTYHTALKLDNRPPERWFNLANAMRAAGRFDDAISAYDCAIALRPNFLAAINNRALAMHESDRPDEAIDEYRQAIQLFPTSVELWKNLGNSLYLTGQLHATIEAYHRASSDPRAAGNALYISHYLPETTVDSLVESCRQWNETYARPVMGATPMYGNDRSADRKLRIGYVSPDLNGHPVGRFMLPLLAHHDRTSFEIHCYSDTLNVDDVSQQLRAAAHSWRVTNGLSDEQLAALIRQDQIDILIDLTMHTRGNRLLAFARKPAPLQATYLAYVGTTGLPTIDYRFTDSILDPPGDSTPWAEQAIRLRSFWCYRPPPDAGEIAPLPADSSGFITFGCLNAFSKVNDSVCDLWTSILSAVPNSQLLLHVPRGKSRDRMRDRLGPRVEFASRIARAGYFALYSRIDIALDPFPYPGGTTSCDALWMGVPVVSLSGRIPMSRAGASILRNANLPELVAESKDDYFRIATELANDRDRLRRYRSSLRERFRTSPIMDEPGFTREFEAALRRMWAAWCDATQVPT